MEPPKDDAQHEYEVDRIMRQRTREGVEEYYIHWKGYPAEDDTWEPKANLSKAALPYKNQMRVNSPAMEGEFPPSRKIPSELRGFEK
jgi:hypothetical protein